MFEFLVVFQYFGIALLLFEIFFITNKWTSRPKILLLLFVVAALINNVGYLLEITAATPEAAIIGTKFSYLGKSYTPLVMVLFTLQCCKVKVPQKIVAAFMLLHSVILFLVLSCEHHTLYYSSIGYDYEGGLFPHLVLGHGIVYNCYMALLIIYMISIPVVLVCSLMKNKDADEKKQIHYLLIMSAVVIGGYFPFILGVTGGYDTTNISYILASVILLYAIYYGNLFNPVTIAKDYVIDNLDDGLVVLGKNDELVFYNNLAEKIFPMLGKNHGVDAINIIESYVDNSEELFFEENVYQVSETPMVNQEQYCGKMFFLTDITDSYNYMNRLKRDVEEKTKEVKHIQRSVIASFANMIEARDGVTGLHIKNTSAYVEIIVNELKKNSKYKNQLSDLDSEIMVDAAPLHDIGKIAVLDSILNKPGKLTPEEFEIIKTHAEAGAKIIDETLTEVERDEYLCVARDMAHYHHERWDGTGYPNGLKGEQIPLCARIMAIADVYDALRSKRCYKEAFSIEKSMQIMRESSGTHFDPELLEIFLENVVKIDTED